MTKAKKKTPTQRAQSRSTQAERDADGKPTKTERIEHILSLMATGKFVTGVTIRELAAEWGFALQTIKEDAAEASRWIRQEVASSEEIQAQIVGTLQTIAKETMKRAQYRTAVEAIRVLAGVTGAEAPKKHEFGGTLGELFAIADRKPEDKTS